MLIGVVFDEHVECYRCAGLCLRLKTSEDDEADGADGTEEACGERRVCEGCWSNHISSLDRINTFWFVRWGCCQHGGCFFSEALGAIWRLFDRFLLQEIGSALGYRWSKSISTSKVVLGTILYYLVLPLLRCILSCTNHWYFHGFIK